MKLAEIGEFGLIDRIAKMFGDLSKPGYMGIGDDCAVIPYTEKENMVITTDLLIEDIHFLKDKISPEHLGYKSLAVNLSDIAAMGAEPVGSFLSIGIPGDTNVEYIDAFMKGYHRLSAAYDVPLLGGDTTRSGKKLVINVVVIGKCRKGNALLRSAAQTNDIVCVTGYLGDSAAGLEVILKSLIETDEHMQLINSHYLPEPQLKEGQWLANRPGVHAMMDVSDGISSDLTHILRASDKSAIIYLDNLPVSDALKKAAAINGWDTDLFTTSGGEDYVLLCTIDEKFFNEISNDFFAAFNRNIFSIGKIIDGDSSIIWEKNGRQVKFSRHGFDHFRT
jgi:thiamine-monophosphate kinase